MWFLPYGVILFAFEAISALPEMREELCHEEKKLKKAILIGSIIPIFFYILFVIAVYGFAGSNTPEIATEVLGKFPSLLAVFTMFTAFCAIGTALKEMFIFDFKIKKNTAFFWTIFPVVIFSFIIMLFKLADFVKILGLIGSIAGGIAGILVLLMAYKAKKKSERKPEYSIPLSWPIILILALIFLAGIIYQFVF